MGDDDDGLPLPSKDPGGDGRTGWQIGEGDSAVNGATGQSATWDPDNQQWIDNDTGSALTPDPSAPIK